MLTGVCDQILKLCQAHSMRVHLYIRWCNMRCTDIDLIQAAVGQAYSVCAHLYTMWCNVRYIAVDLTQPSVGSRLYVVAKQLKQRMSMCSTRKLELAGLQ